MTKPELFELLLEQFLILNENRDRLIEAATTGEQAAQILAAWRQANTNQLELGNRIIIQNSQQLDNLIQEFKSAQTDLKDVIAGLQSVAGGLNQVTAVINTAVSLGTQNVSIV